MATSKAFRTSAFVATEDQLTQLITFRDLVDSGELGSKRKQCKWLAANTDMTTGDIAKYLEIRFQQVYQAIKG